MRLPSVALSVRQPWAWLIVNGYKDVENRNWPTRFRGPVLIHAGKAWGPDERDVLEDLRAGYNPVDYCLLPQPISDLLEVPELGGIVGVAEIEDCVSSSRSRWFVGPYGFLIRNARPLPFRPLRGRLGFFEVGEGQ